MPEATACCDCRTPVEVGAGPVCGPCLESEARKLCRDEGRRHQLHGILLAVREGAAVRPASAAIDRLYPQEADSEGGEAD